MEDSSKSFNQASQPATFFAFDSPKGQSAYIKVIGVGGGGGNAVNHMYKEGIEGVDFIVCNTDMKALNASPVPNKIPLGDLGLGAGNKPERARVAAEAKAEDIREAISHNTQMLFITAGMGGGTGTGAAPVIAEIAKSIDLENDENKKILVVAIVTKPFSFEGGRRRDQAFAGIEELRKHVDSIIVINNDKLRSFGNLTLSQAFGMADDVLLTAVKGIAEIITKNAHVIVDFQDVNTVMERSGTALMGTGSGAGENRALDAIAAATSSVLLDDSDISGAKNVLLYFSYSPEHELTMDEQADITDYVLDKTNGTADIIWGAGPDETLGDELKVILIATGFEKSSGSAAVAEPRVHRLPEPEEVRVVQPAMEEPAEMAIIHREAVQAEAECVSVPAAVAAPVAAQRTVHVLEDESPVAEAWAPAPVAPVSEEDKLVQEIHLIDTLEAPQSASSPRVEPKPAAPDAETIARSAFESRNDLKLTADRIRYIHDLLRNNPNGADLVQAMPASEVGGAELYEGNHSSVREASGYTMRADGTVVKTGWLGDQPD